MRNFEEEAKEMKRQLRDAHFKKANEQLVSILDAMKVDVEWDSEEACVYHEITKVEYSELFEEVKQRLVNDGFEFCSVDDDRIRIRKYIPV